MTEQEFKDALACLDMRMIRARVIAILLAKKELLDGSELPLNFFNREECEVEFGWADAFVSYIRGEIENAEKDGVDPETDIKLFVDEETGKGLVDCLMFTTRPYEGTTMDVYLFSADPKKKSLTEYRWNSVIAAYEQYKNLFDITEICVSIVQPRIQNTNKFGWTLKEFLSEVEKDERNE